MSTIPSAQAPSSGAPRADAPAEAHRNGGRQRIRPGRIFTLALAVAAVAGGLAWALRWVEYRRTHSMTDDAFVEAHIVNIAPQLVSGRIVRFLAEENDRVVQGEVLAVIDPIPYRDKIHSARAQLDSALAELDRERAVLARTRKEVPIQVEIARRTFASAVADRARAEESLRLTEDDVDKGIDQARAELKAVQADLVLALADHGRISNLESRGSATRQELDQRVRTRDASRAHVELGEARLAKALSARTQVDVARRTLEAAQKAEQKAAKGIELAEVGNDEVREVELLVKVKERTADQARQALEAAENDLAYTRVRAPFPGVVVKRYRHLGDFASAGSPVLSMYDPDLLYVEANLEEDRLPGVEAGNAVRIALDAFAKPFRGRVVWINKSTGAQFALLPRNVVSGEFTRVVQRVPVRIEIERDDRWPQLRAGLSATVSIVRGPGDPAWAADAAQSMERLETRYNASGAQVETTPEVHPAGAGKAVMP